MNETAIDWQHWLGRWEAQQDYVVQFRQERFEVMLDVLGVLFEDRPFTFLDLACGPGSLSRRVLERFANSRAVGVDLDPILIAMGKNGDNPGGRLSLVEADLRDPQWLNALGQDRFDAVLSSTALHWLPVPDLVGVYRTLADLIPEGGVFINCDNMAYSPRLDTIRRIDEALRNRRRETAGEGEGFQEWWQAVGEDPGLHDLYEQRQRLFEWRDSSRARAGYATQKTALEEAGFKEVTTIFQHGQNRVLVAIR